MRGPAARRKGSGDCAYEATLVPQASRIGFGFTYDYVDVLCFRCACRTILMQPCSRTQGRLQPHRTSPSNATACAGGATLMEWRGVISKASRARDKQKPASCEDISCDSSQQHQHLPNTRKNKWESFRRSLTQHPQNTQHFKNDDLIQKIIAQGKNETKQAQRQW